MQAIEFSTRPQKGLIRLPASCKSYNDQPVRVIVLKEDRPSGNTQKSVLKSFEGVIQLREEPLAYQKSIRREWK
jgi:hypothetical protein